MVLLYWTDQVTDLMSDTVDTCFVCCCSGINCSDQVDWTLSCIYSPWCIKPGHHWHQSLNFLWRVKVSPSFTQTSQLWIKQKSNRQTKILWTLGVQVQAQLSLICGSPNINHTFSNSSVKQKLEHQKSNAASTQPKDINNGSKHITTTSTTQDSWKRMIRFASVWGF